VTTSRILTLARDYLARQLNTMPPALPPKRKYAALVGVTADEVRRARATLRVI